MSNVQLPNKSSRQGGFSMVELIITVAIIGIMSSFVVIGYGRYQNEQKLKLASSSFVQYLKSAQRRSQQTLEPCKVIVDHKNLTLSISNSTSCTNLKKLSLVDTIDGMNSQDLKICGTSTVANTSMTCGSTDGSDLDPNTNQPKEQSTITFTPRGSVSEGGLFKLNSAKAKRSLCIVITQPIGLIREGIEIEKMQNKTCDFVSYEF